MKHRASFDVKSLSPKSKNRPIPALPEKMENWHKKALYLSFPKIYCHLSEKTIRQINKYYSPLIKIMLQKKIIVNILVSLAFQKLIQNNSPLESLAMKCENILFLTPINSSSNTMFFIFLFHFSIWIIYYGRFYAAVGDKIYFLLMYNICYINNFMSLIIDANLIVPHVPFSCSSIKTIYFFN